ncbi:endonuclease Rec12 [Schizosaccharomyces cryophilus OY26]|uniref:DNA topoisomerase (ATP-hydrolyzing) n=1 Tax=Schizosaccharomyces cryophilus (strain OY26 / ATCC MYA-4695 / CBS 11777 / NBRC 106824 / NRRL Y48691) TaxID=653667 RepID=S9XIE5_SCHCR|nr:endonuclease Rec12 [Schizosaccharomyces cryophilus OY26]EPY53436.1 endonuclease Rec12 [Schizosaccharomyces cryophilus OY26]
MSFIKKEEEEVDFVNVKESIETIVESFLKQLADPSKTPAFLSLSKRKSNGRVSSFKNSLSKTTRPKKYNIIKHPAKVAQILQVLDCIHEAIDTESVVTKRDIFYHDVQLFKRQAVVDELIEDIACTIGCPRSALNVEASGKGLVYGPLTINLQEGVKLETSKPTLISYHPISSIDSTAKWVLVIEKEAVFQTLVERGLEDIILITAKGFPDMSTRKLLLEITKYLPELPIFGIFDWDPYGILIYSCYKHGSKASGYESSILLPQLQFLGPFYQDIFPKNYSYSLSLGKRDVKVASNLLQSDCLRYEPHMREQLQRMLFLQKKAELQAIPNLFKWVEQKLLETKWKS